MPRATSRDRSGASYAPQANAFRSGIPIAAPSGVDQKATALQQALGILAPATQKVWQNTENENAQQGGLDASRGTIDQAKLGRSKAYEKAAVQTQTAASFVQAEGEFRQWYDESFDKSKGTPEDLSKALDDFLRERYGHINDRLEADVLVPRMAELRQRLVREQQENLQLAVKTDQVSAISMLVRDAVAKRQPIDADAMKGQMLPMFSKAEAAENFANIIGTLAVEHGEPSLIDTIIPEKWADGTPGPRSIPKIANQLNQYRAYAESAQNKANAEAKQLLAQKTEQGQVRIAQLAASGNIMGAQRALDEIATGLTRSDYTALVGFIQGQRDDQREQSYDPNTYIQWRVNVVENPTLYADPMYIMRNAAHLFPPGPQRQSQIAQAMDDAISARNSYRNNETKPLVKAYREALTTQFKPDTLSTTAEKQLYAEGMFAFDKTLAETDDAEKANEAARSILSKSDELKKAGTAGGGSSIADLRAVATGTLRAEAFLAKYPKQDPSELIRAGMRDKENPITREEAAVLINALR